MSAFNWKIFEGFWGSKRNFLDLDKGYHNYFNDEVGSTNPIYIPDTPLQCFLEIAHLRTVIARNAEMLNNGIWMHLDRDGNEIVDSKYVARLKNPNPIQGKYDFLSQISINYDVLANTFVNKVVGLKGEVPRALYVLPSEKMEVIPTGKVYKQIELDKIIKHYEMSQLNKTNEIFQLDEIIHIKQPDNGVLVGQPKIDTLRVKLSNLVGALEARNVLINNRGAIGILSYKEAKSMIGLSPTDKKEGEEKLVKTYGTKRGQRRIQISNVPVEYNQMAMKVQDLMLFEEEESSFQSIIDAFGQHRNLFSNTKGSTFNNVKESEKNVYRNNIIPRGELIANNFTNGLFTEEMISRGERLKLCFAHLDILQESKLEENQAAKIEAETLAALNALLETNAITQDEYDRISNKEKSI